MCQLREAKRHGSDVGQKNTSYTMGSHQSLLNDKVRCDAYLAAIGNAAAGKRVLDIGSGPFLLLGRMSRSAGANFVACVEASRSSVQMALHVLEREVSPPRVLTCPLSLCDEEEMAIYMRELDRHGVRVPLRFLHAEQGSTTIAMPCARAAPDGEAHGVAPPVDSAAAPRAAGAAAAAPPVTSAAAAPSTSSCVLELYEGVSSAVALPGGIELVVHEILGHVASAEGVVRTIRELRTRHGLLTENVKLIPSAAGTLIAPTAPIPPGQVEHQWTAAAAHTESGLPPPHAGHMYHAVRFPPGLLLAPPQPLEWYVFDGALERLETDLGVHQWRACRFAAPPSGSFFDGLHMHLVVQLDASTFIHTHDQDTTWECLYVRLLSTPLWLAPGDAIELRTHVDASSDRPCYHIETWLHARGQTPTHVGAFRWSGDG